MPAVRDITGQRFNSLVALRDEGSEKGQGRLWRFRCDCGNEIVRRLGYVTSGNTTSCGCRQLLRPNHLQHGHTRNHRATRTWSTWNAMLRRCSDVKFAEYPRYGGSGISVCESWHVFENFLADMGERPVGRTIDRIDSYGNYEPANCRWATPKEQASHTRPRKKRTHCRRGHPRLPENLDKWNNCRPCQRIRNRARFA